MSKPNSAYDFIAKLLIIGDSGVGKTCLLLRFCENNFTVSHLATIGTLISNLFLKSGIDFKLKNIEVDGKKIKMQIWDTAGQDRFKTITQTYYRGAMGIILAYACNDRESFQNIENWIKQIKQHATDDVCKILVGNKSDMSDRVIDYAEGKKLADTYGMKFFETSAKDDMGVNDAFHSIAKEIKEKFMNKDYPGGSGKQDSKDLKPSGVRLTNTDEGPKKNSSCC